MAKNDMLQMSKLCKENLRNMLLTKRKNLSLAECTQASIAVQKNVLRSQVWQKAKTVGLYMAKGCEVQTQLLVESAWQEGKKMYLPRCNPQLYGHMDFICCKSYADVTKGAYGIQEPTLAALQRQQNLCDAENFSLDILLVPGVGFDLAGHRIGFGGGYYDRFLQMLEGQKTCCIGAAFTWQVLEKIPAAKWDMPVQALVTEEALLWI